MFSKCLIVAMTALLGATNAKAMSPAQVANGLKTFSKFVSPIVGYDYGDTHYDPEFWEGFDEEEEPYTHNWADIPDFVNRTELSWKFNQTHHVLVGIERGMYMDDSIELDPDCFGERYVDRINWLAAMFQSDPGAHWIQILSLFYQIYYMWGEKCKIDHTLADLYVYCWNEGCQLGEMWENTEANFLYMTRAIIDAAIVWYEGIPESEEVDQEQWHNLSR